jgi:hypothetical protein
MFQSNACHSSTLYFVSQNNITKKLFAFVMFEKGRTKEKYYNERDTKDKRENSHSEHKK